MTIRGIYCVGNDKAGKTSRAPRGRTSSDEVGSLAPSAKAGRCQHAGRINAHITATHTTAKVVYCT